MYSNHLLKRELLTERWRKAVSSFSFDSLLATFTPKMAKRTVTIPAGATAAPLFQGKWNATGVSDIVDVARKSLLVVPSVYYPDIDTTQGTILFWITPEWNGNDGLDHCIYAASSYGSSVTILKNTASALFCYLEYDGAVIGTSVSVASWVAGTAYFVVLRWDSKRKIDGTNAVCISINDVNTFGSPHSYTPNGPYLWSTMGSAYTGNAQPANAIISGFTVYRRLLGDGFYGQPTIPRRDEMNLIYAAGAGVRPETICPEDILFQFPTTGTAGQLSTGVGEAWDFPSVDNIQKHWTFEDGGYLGGDFALAIDSGVTVNCGSGATLDDLHAAAFTAEGWFRSWNGANSTLINKTNFAAGWGVYLSGQKAAALLYTAGGIVTTGFTTTSYGTDGLWHHYAATYDNAGDRILRLYIDGTLQATSGAASGLIVSDAALNLMLCGGLNGNLIGSCGWHRISNNIRYSTNFIAPRTMPAADGNTVEQWAVNEGTGTTITASVTTPANNGTVGNGLWVRQWNTVGTPVIPYGLDFNGVNSTVNCGSNASIDDLTDNALTLEMWVCIDTLKDYSYLISKGAPAAGFTAQIFNNSIICTIQCATTTTAANGAFPVGLLGRAVHIAWTWDDAGDRKVRYYLNGEIQSVSAANVGAIVADAAFNLNLGSEGGGTFFDGKIYWVRVSNSVRYTDDFVPPSRLNPPAADDNTMAQYNFRDGAGTTLTDVTGVNNGTITAGTWNTTPNMAVDVPNTRIYPWGYVFGGDAVDEGISQTTTGLVAGADYVCLPVISYERDYQAKPYINIYDNIGAALIVKHPLPWLTGTHSTGENAAALVDSSAPPWPASLIGGRVYNITDGSYGTITAAGSSIVATLAGSGGTDNNWDVGDVYRISPYDEWIYNEYFCFELPTGCTSITVSVLNDAAAGAMYIHQLQILPNLVNNGGMEGTYDDESGGGGGTVNVAPGWNLFEVETDGTDTLNESAIAHSGSKSQEINVNASGEGVQLATTCFTQNKWHLITCYLYGISGQVNIIDNFTTTLAETVTPPVGVWTKYSFIRYFSGANRRLIFRSGGVANFLVDDVAVIELDDVTITVTPASLANSTEGAGVRVDGNDALIQTIPAGKLGATNGEIRFNYTPRHDAALSDNFGNTSAYICTIYDSTYTSFIFIQHHLTSTTHQFWTKIGGVTVASSFTYSFVANTTYQIKISYNTSGANVYINGVLVTTNAYVGLNFGTEIMYYFYAGSSPAVSSQIDAVFS